MANKRDERFVAGAQKGSSMSFDLSFDFNKMSMVATTRRLPGIPDDQVFGRHQPMRETLGVGLPPHWTWVEVDRKFNTRQVVYTYRLDDGTATLKQQVQSLEKELEETREVAERAIFNRGWSDGEVMTLFGLTLAFGMSLGAVAYAIKVGQ